ncbi:MAG TPA: AraC family transcriptional regulator [Chthoniobacteraceae bacterium]|nr:AraC family transcriptional regulator [Chthoniobacteraceae bacterium]
MHHEPIITATKAGVRETRTSPSYELRVDSDLPRRHRVILQWTLSGRGIFELEGRKWELRPEKAFIALQPENGRFYYPPKGREAWTFSWIDFLGPMAKDAFRQFRDQFGPVVELRENSLPAIRLSRLIADVASKKPRSRWETSVQAYTFLMEWWQEAIQPLTGSMMIETVVKLCEAHEYELFTVKELAAECGVSREGFTRIFKRFMGTSPAAYLRERRLKAAATLLKGSALSLPEIARKTGFSSGHHLMTALRRRYGVITSELR